MKKYFVYSLLATLVTTGCQKEQEVFNPENNDGQKEITQEPAKVFTAIVDDDFNKGTKTSLNGSGNVLWKLGDQVSIFAASTVNEHYQVSDASDGKTSATLNKIPAGGFVAGTEIDNNVAFYPYASTAEIAKSGDDYVISGIELPATQTYAAGSFGNGAFPMAAVTSTTEDMNLKFKNVLGGLKLQLKGTATITSITVTGNNNEILCGDAEVAMTYGGVPSISLSDASAKTVTLDCGAGVTLDPETAIPFIIALPPMTMTGGFTVIVTDTEGKEMEIKTTRSQTITRSNLLKMPAVDYVGISLAAPLKFTSTGSTSISLIKTGSPIVHTLYLEYKVDDGVWTDYTVGDAIPLTDGQELSFRAGASGNSSFSREYDFCYTFAISGEGTVAASGNVMSLLNREGGLTIPSSSCFNSLFLNCTKLTTAPELPATTVSDNCYKSMFEGCTSLTTAPSLPATTMAERCYYLMFNGCTSLITAPALPATTLAVDCYTCMFMNCTSLATAPALPATTLTNECYGGMFWNCTSLATAPALPATSLATHCYIKMFEGCTSLATAPALPATSLATHCYESMFNGCTSLTTAPELPATTLYPYCYNQMFEGCNHLTTAPTLPATSLEEGCYFRMFLQCTSLTTAPTLPATSLSDYCYDQMFAGCTSLNYIKALFTTTPSNQYTSDWMLHVAATGTFVKSASASWDNRGSDSVPLGWTIETE